MTPTLLKQLLGLIAYSHRVFKQKKPLGLSHCRPRHSVILGAASLIVSSLTGSSKMQPPNEFPLPCTFSSSSMPPPSDTSSSAAYPNPPQTLESCPSVAETCPAFSEDDEPPLLEAARTDDESNIETDVGTGSRRQGDGQWFRLTESCVLVLHQGDITKWFVDGKTDAIVNAANERMLGGGGVDGAIHRAAGRKLYEECLHLPLKEKGVRCRTGEAVITNAYKLPVSRIIHTVGPVYEDKSSAGWLEKAYKSSVALAAENGIKHMAFPAISCGVYGYPYDEAAEVALRTLERVANGLQEIHFVLFEKGAWEAWMSAADQFEKV